MTKSSSPSSTPTKPVPPALRIGGAHLGAALVLAFLALMSVFGDGFGQPFSVELSTVALVCAGALVGAFATTSTSHEGSKMQIYALCGALFLIGVSRVLPATLLFQCPQYVIAAVAFLLLVPAFLFRRIGAAQA